MPGAEGVAPTPPRLDGIPGSGTAHLDRLLTRFATHEIRGRLVMIGSATGTGKSTLIEDMLAPPRAGGDRQTLLLIPVHGPSLLDGPGRFLAPRATEPGAAPDQVPLAMMRTLVQALHFAVVRETCRRITERGHPALAETLRVDMLRGDCELRRIRAVWKGATSLRDGLFSTRKDAGWQEVSALWNLGRAYMVTSGVATAKRELEKSRSAESKGKVDVTLPWAQVLGPALSLLAGGAVGAQLFKETPIAAALTALLAAAGGSWTWSREVERKDSFKHHVEFAEGLDITSLARWMPVLLRQLKDVGVFPVFVVDEVRVPEWRPIEDTLLRQLDVCRGFVNLGAFMCLLVDRTSYLTVAAQDGTVRRRLDDVLADSIFLSFDPEKLREQARGASSSSARLSDEEARARVFRARGRPLGLDDWRATTDADVGMQRVQALYQEAVEATIAAQPWLAHHSEARAFAIDLLYAPAAGWEAAERVFDNSAPALARWAVESGWAEARPRPGQDAAVAGQDATAPVPDATPAGQDAPSAGQDAPSASRVASGWLEGGRLDARFVHLRQQWAEHLARSGLIEVRGVTGRWLRAPGGSLLTGWFANSGHQAAWLQEVESTLRDVGGLSVDQALGWIEAQPSATPAPDTRPDPRANGLIDHVEDLRALLVGSLYVAWLRRTEGAVTSQQVAFAAEKFTEFAAEQKANFADLLPGLAQVCPFDPEGIAPWPLVPGRWRAAAVEVRSALDAGTGEREAARATQRKLAEKTWIDRVRRRACLDEPIRLDGRDLGWIQLGGDLEQLAQIPLQDRLVHRWSRLATASLPSLEWVRGAALSVLGFWERIVPPPGASSDVQNLYRQLRRRFHSEPAGEEPAPGVRVLLRTSYRNDPGGTAAWSGPSQAGEPRVLASERPFAWRDDVASFDEVWWDLGALPSKLVEAERAAAHTDGTLPAVEALLSPSITVEQRALAGRLALPLVEVGANPAATLAAIAQWRKAAASP